MIEPKKVVWGVFIFTAIMIVLMLAISILYVVKANAEPIGKVETSGMFMKDSIEIHSFNDPDYPTISCFFTSPKRSMSWEHQTNSSISCRLIGKAPIGKLTNRKSIVQDGKSLFNTKAMQIDRFYNKSRNTMVYISYTKKLSGDNASHSLSVVPLGK